jgi:D-arabinose 1-dehydrogenase-like Zn-dependent alcohol dehydrogenase
MRSVLASGYLPASADITLQCGSGHESAGEVVEVGEGVTQWKAGKKHIAVVFRSVHLSI